LSIDVRKWFAIALLLFGSVLLADSAGQAKGGGHGGGHGGSHGSSHSGAACRASHHAGFGTSEYNRVSPTPIAETARIPEQADDAGTTTESSAQYGYDHRGADDR